MHKYIHFFTILIKKSNVQFLMRLRKINGFECGIYLFFIKRLIYKVIDAIFFCLDLLKKPVMSTDKHNFSMLITFPDLGNQIIA